MGEMGRGGCYNVTALPQYPVSVAFFFLTHHSFSQERKKEKKKKQVIWAS